MSTMMHFRIHHCWWFLYVITHSQIRDCCGKVYGCSINYVHLLYTINIFAMESLKLVFVNLFLIVFFWKHWIMKTTFTTIVFGSSNSWSTFFLKLCPIFVVTVYSHKKYFGMFTLYNFAFWILQAKAQSPNWH